MIGWEWFCLTGGATVYAKGYFPKDARSQSDFPGPPYRGAKLHRVA